jgi:hypothetical protein
VIEASPVALTLAFKAMVDEETEVGKEVVRVGITIIEFVVTI